MILFGDICRNDSSSDFAFKKEVNLFWFLPIILTSENCSLILQVDCFLLPDKFLKRLAALKMADFLSLEYTPPPSGLAARDDLILSKVAFGEAELLLT